MYCHKCGAQAKSNSKFCWKCGTNLISDNPSQPRNSPQPAPDPIRSPPNLESPEDNATQRYYQKLRKALEKNGFMFSPNELANDAVEQSYANFGGNLYLKLLMLVNQAGPYGVIMKPIYQKLIGWSGADGEEVSGIVENIQTDFELLAIKYYIGKLCVIAATNGDDLSIEEAEELSDSLCQAMLGLYTYDGTGKRWIKNFYRQMPSVYCMFVFFNQDKAESMTKELIKRCRKHISRIKPWIHTVSVTPLVCIVPTREIKPWGAVVGGILGTVTDLSKETLMKAFN